MSVRMSADEAAAFLAGSDVGILSTLRRDGAPIALPMWFALVDGDVCFRSRESGRKVARLGRDPRVSFVVDRGAAWSELAAVVVNGMAEVATGELRDRIEAALTAKYAGRGVPDTVPQQTIEHYAAPTMHYRIVPDDRPLTWNNARLLA